MQEFQPAVIEALKYYVYCLVNPRDKKIFYIGKGKGNILAITDNYFHTWRISRSYELL